MGIIRGMPRPRNWPLPSPPSFERVSPACALAFLLHACAPAPAATSPAPVPPAEEVPLPSAEPATSDKAPGWESVDSRAIRCGVDDRPINILKTVDIQKEEVGVKPSRAKPAFIPPEPPETPPALKVERGAARILGATQATLDPAFNTVDLGFASCSPISTATRPPKPMTFLVGLASSGAPLWVAPTGEGQPSAYAHCLMERFCQLRAQGASTSPFRVEIPLKFSFDFRPGDVLPEDYVQVQIESPRQEDEELERQLSSLATNAARRCGMVSERLQARYSVVVEQSEHSSSRRGRVTKVRFNTVTNASVKLLEGGNQDLISCVLAAFKGGTFLGAATQGNRHTKQITVTWTP